MTEWPDYTETEKVVRGREILVPPGYAAAFANAIIRLAENPAERERLGKAAREFAVKELDRKKILSDFNKAIDSIMVA